jgi:hypothetical protein
MGVTPRVVRRAIRLNFNDPGKQTTESEMPSQQLRSRLNDIF